MIRGLVNERLEAIATVEIVGPSERRAIDLIIDTGFTGSMTLTSEAILELDLQRVGALPGKLANGAEVEFAAFTARISWHDTEIEIAVLESAGGNLLGMALLEGHRLSLDVVNQGTVTIEPLGRPPLVS